MVSEWEAEYAAMVEEGERIVRERRPDELIFSEAQWAAEMIAAFEREDDGWTPLRKFKQTRRNIIRPLPRREDGRCVSCPKPALKRRSECHGCLTLRRRAA